MTTLGTWGEPSLGLRGDATRAPGHGGDRSRCSLTDPAASRYLPMAAMELAPEDRPRETIYEMTGWQDVDGRLCYLSPAGGVGVPEGVKVDLANLEAGIGLSQDGLAIEGVADGGDEVFDAGLKALLSPVLDSFSRAVMLPALPARVMRSRVLTGGTATVRQSSAGLEIGVPPGDRAPLFTVVALELDRDALDIPAVAGRPRLE